MSQRSSRPNVVHMMFFDGVTNARGSRASAGAGAVSAAAARATMTASRRIIGASLTRTQGLGGRESARIERPRVDCGLLAADQLGEEAAGDRAEAHAGALVAGRG